MKSFIRWWLVVLGQNESLYVCRQEVIERERNTSGGKRSTKSSRRQERCIQKPGDKLTLGKSR